MEDTSFDAYEVPAEWMPIVSEIVDQIEHAGATVFQVKEKFGGLRIYIDDYGMANQVYIDQLIDAAEFRVGQLFGASGI